MPDQNDYNAIARACLGGDISDPVYDMWFEAIGFLSIEWPSGLLAILHRKPLSQTNFNRDYREQLSILRAGQNIRLLGALDSGWRE